jgi:hypothetical protein
MDRKKNLTKWLLIDEFWEPKLCHFCVTEESDEFIEGLRPCESSETGFKCKHLDNAKCKKLGLDLNPFHLRSCGGFSEALRLIDISIALSGRDSVMLQKADTIDLVCGDVSLSESLFFDLAKIYIENIRIKESYRIHRAKNE